MFPTSVTYLAWIISLGIIGGLASAVLRTGPRLGTLLTVSVDLNAVRRARQVHTSLLGIDGGTSKGFTAYGQVSVAAGRNALCAAVVHISPRRARRL